MARPKENDVSGRLEMRFDERLRYLSEIAARAKGMTNREYLEWAVDRSFAEVDLRKLPQGPRPKFEMVNGRPVIVNYSERDAGDRELQGLHTLEHWKNGLWYHSPFLRLIALTRVVHVLQEAYPEEKFDHLLTPEQNRIWSFLSSSDEFLIKATGRLNEKYIEENWQRVKDDALGGMVTK
jgi:predicted DNA-binding protein